jgi:hypothetical protein
MAFPFSMLYSWKPCSYALEVSVPFLVTFQKKGLPSPIFDIPAGTTVSASVYSLHRNPKAFPKPKEWRPERWVEATNESKKDMMKGFWVFEVAAGCALAIT